MVSVRSRAGRCRTAPGARVTSTTLKVGEPSSSRSVQCISVPTSAAECSIASVSRWPMVRSKSSPGVRIVVVSGSSPIRISSGSSTATVSVRSTRPPVSTSSRVRRTRVVTRPMRSSKHTPRPIGPARRRRRLRHTGGMADPTPVTPARPAEVTLRGGDLPWRPVSPMLTRVRLISVGIVVLPVLLATVVAAVFATRWLLVATLVVVLVGLWAVWLVGRQVSAISWVEVDEEIVIRKGRMLRTLVSVPYGRLQYVDIQSGPLERAFGIASCEIHTASPESGGSLPGLPVAEPVPGPSGEWQRLHPLSPLLRGGVVLLAILGYAASQMFDTFLNSLGFGDVFVGTDGSPIDNPGGGDDPFEQAVHHPFIALAGLVLFLAVIAAVNWVSWRYSRFRVGGGQVELRQGVLFRQHRQVRLERVQAVELSRPLLARALGLARVVVQSAGGSDSTLTLSFLGLDRAESLREHLLELAGRTDEVATHPAE